MIHKLAYLFLAFLLLSCWGKGNPNRKLTPVDASQIEYGEILDGFGDSVSVELTDKQISKFVHLINTTKNAQMYKAFPQYVIVLKTDQDTLIYKLTGNLLGENDLYIELKDSTYFPDLYENGTKQRALIEF